MPCVEDLENGLCINRTLEETKAFLGTPKLMVYTNSVRFDSTKYGEDKYIRESTISNLRWNLDKP